MKERLQLIHCEELFKTSAEARDYVDFISYNRPPLYAEPMVLKYGNEENPNILLAIGSVGDGETPSRKNKVFFIDFADVEESIKEIKEQIEAGSLDPGVVSEQINKIIGSCGFDEDGNYIPNQEDETLKNAKSLNDADKLLSKAISDTRNEIAKLQNFNVNDSNTISHELVSGENGNVLTSNVKLSDFRTVGNCNFNNIIVEQNDGIYANVRLNYNKDENKLVFGVNDDVKEIKLPKENHVVGGTYDIKTESLILTFKEPIDGDSKILSIDLKDLIGEWTVLGENTDTPIILTKTPVKSDDILHGNVSYQDELKADIRIASAEYKPHNILQKTEDNRYLFVNGVASNIKYSKNGKMITVKQALDEIDCNVSTHDGNVIYRKEDGIFANIDLEYLSGKNTLKFSKTNKDGDIVVKEINLNNDAFLENIYYDSFKEEIVIQYKDGNGNLKEFRVPISNLFEEWEVDNTNHTVTLVKSMHQTTGKDKLSADVNISSNSDNILHVENHSLYVKGTSDNIKHGNSTVKDALDLINGSEDIEGSINNLIKKEANKRKEADNLIDNKIDSEIERAVSKEKEIENRIDSVNENLENKDNELSLSISNLEKDFNSEILKVENLIADNAKDIDAETERAIKEEEKLSGKIDENTDNILALDDKIEQKAKDLSCIAVPTDNITLERKSNAPFDGYSLSGRVNISSLPGNIINQKGALYASVDLQYNSATNVLTLKTSNGTSKDIQLVGGGGSSIIKEITYDSENKCLVIVYIGPNQTEQIVNVPISDLYNEWDVENSSESVIELTKTKGTDGQPDKLKAELKLDDSDNSNLLQNKNGKLYASNKASDIKLSDNGDVETIITNLDERVKEIEENGGGSANVTVEDTSSIDLTLSNSTIKGEVKISAEEDNQISINDDGLFVSMNYDFGTY